MQNSKYYHRRYRAANRDRLVEYKRIWNKKNRSRISTQRAVRYATRRDLFLNNELKFKFGISLEQYEAMLLAQNHSCSICGVPAAELKKRMSVDHDHATGKVRALLCHHCNAGLGYFKDNEQILTKAIKYLYEHTEQNDSIGKNETLSLEPNGSAALG